jgi:hypothetical protein
MTCHRWLGGLLWESDAGKDIFRMKGILSVSGDDSRRVLQVGGALGGGVVYSNNASS